MIHIAKRGRTGFRLQVLSLVFALSILPQLSACDGDTTQGSGAIPTDYSDARNWVVLPASPASATQAVDVFFVHPTTYNSNSASQPALTSIWSPGWNQTLAQAYADSSIKFQIASKIGVFAKAGTTSLLLTTSNPRGSLC